MTTAAALSDAHFARDHYVQFYQDQSILLARLEGIVRDGLRDGLRDGHGLLIHFSLPNAAIAESHATPSADA